MVTVRIKGGLGNQLFQYAAGYALAKRLNQPMQMDISFFPEQTLRGFKLAQLNTESNQIVEKCDFPVSLYKNKYLNKLLRIADVRVLPCGHKGTFLLETRSDIVPEYFTIDKDNVYLDGYYQSEEYFKEYKKELLQQFIPNYEPQEDFVAALNMILESGNNSVAVHVRRGDFLRVQHSNNSRQYLLGKAYYHNAIRYMNMKLSSPSFFWFSDDIEWVKQNFGDVENHHFISMRTQQPDIDEMMLMKNCSHIIAANSTFSWWAAWLNGHEDAIRICPAKRYGNLHMIPIGWKQIRID